MIKIIFFLPLTISGLIRAWLFPRWLFIKTYQPSSELERQDENDIKNKLRLIDYKIKRSLHGKE